MQEADWGDGREWEAIAEQNRTKSPPRKDKVPVTRKKRVKDKRLDRPGCK